MVFAGSDTAHHCDSHFVDVLGHSRYAVDTSYPRWSLMDLPHSICFFDECFWNTYSNVTSNWAISLEENHADSLVSAGKYIGILERLFVFTFVVTGNWDAIGFLLAAKSVFRFGDLKESKDKKLTEYILVGTLLSFSIAVAVGLIVQKLTT